MEREVILKSMVVHSLDGLVPTPILSERPGEIDSALNEYLMKHVEKIMEDSNLKRGKIPEAYIYEKMFFGTDDDFIGETQRFAEEIHTLIHRNMDIPSGDLAILKLIIDERPFVFCLKLNYRTGITNTMMPQEVRLINHHKILPSITQKVDEAFFVDVKERKINILEKKYEVDGEKVNYMSENILKINFEFSSEEKVKIIQTKAKEVIENHYPNSPEKLIEFKSQVAESITEEGNLETEEVFEKVFSDNMEAKNSLKYSVREEGMENSKIHITPKLEKKLSKKQKIVTEDGIEIFVPLDILLEKDKFRYEQNPDGSINIILKDVGQVKR